MNASTIHAVLSFRMPRVFGAWSISKEKPIVDKLCKE